VLSILCLEDNEILRSKFCQALNDWHFAAKVFGAASIVKADHILKSNHIDILLADLNVEDGDATETIQSFSQNYPAGLAIVISGISEPSRILAAISAGAVGYIHKSDSSIQLIGAIEKALDGKSPMSAEIAMHLSVLVQNGNLKLERKQLGKSTILTNKETEVIELISRGLSYSEIARALKISLNTVPVHVRNIYRKLQTINSLALFAFSAASFRSEISLSSSFSSYKKLLLL
jgi:DNA-binding NarL/FixJ family response regulator